MASRQNTEFAIDELGPFKLLQRVTERGLELVAQAEGVLLGLNDGTSITYVCGAGYLRGWIGTRTQIDSSIGGTAILTEQVVHCVDTETDPRVDREVCRRLGTRSTVCVPLSRGQDVFGVLALGSTRPGAFDETDVSELQAMAELISIAAGIAGDLHRVESLLDTHDHRSGLGPDRTVGPPDSAGQFLTGVLNPGAARLGEARRRIQTILDDPCSLQIVFQPIMDLRTDRVVAYEALSRFPGPSAPPPDAWFAEAHEAGLGSELEMLAIDNALRSVPDLPPGVHLTINVGPDTAITPRFHDTISAPGIAERVVVEVTEHCEVGSYDALGIAVRRLRERGARLAIDDTGAGFASLAHILKLAPDIIKLDRELIAGIDIDPVRRALATALVTFGHKTGATLLAEGVETTGELQAVRELGIRLAQGFLIGRPDRLRVLASPVRA